MSQVYVQPVSPVVVQQPMVTTQTVVQQPQQREMKSIAVAYVLWWFFGFFGVHRFYLNESDTGMIYIILLVVGFFTAGITYIASLIFWCVDMCLIPGLVEKANRPPPQTVTVMSSPTMMQPAIVATTPTYVQPVQQVQYVQQPQAQYAHQQTYSQVQYQQ